MEGIKSNKLYNSLFKLSKIVVDKVIEHRQKGKLRSIPYQTIPVRDIDFKSETYSYDWDNVNYFDLYEWRSNEISFFFEKEIYQLPEFEEAANDIINTFNISEDLVKNAGLPKLLLLIVKEVPNGGINLDNINHYIQLFINGYESHKNKKPLTWNIQLWLRNIYIESEEIEICSKVFLRRPSKKDLSLVIQRDYHF